MSQRKTCQQVGIESVAELAQSTGKPARTISNWFSSEPELFKAVLLGCAAQKAAQGGDAIELIQLGLRVKKSSEVNVMKSIDEIKRDYENT